MIQTPLRTRSPARASRCRASDAARTVDRGERLAQAGDALALELDLGLGVLDGAEQPGDDRRPQLRGQPLEQPAGLVGLGVERQAHPEAELGVVLEERVAPGRTAAGGVDRPRRRRQVGAVDRRAAGGVGHDHPVAEELADQAEVGRLAAAAAGARELEQRLQDLAALDGVVGDQARGRAARSSGRSPSAVRSMSRCSATGSMLMALWLVSVLLLAGQTSTQTPQPVQSSGRHLDREPVIGQLARLELLVQEVGRRAVDRGGRGRPSSGSSRAGRPWRTCRSRCRSTDPRPGSSGRSPASRTSSYRSGTCRRPARR